MAFKPVDNKMNLPSVEEGVLKFWEENKIFEKSIENRREAQLYSFYDGPPFATGTPHYGHIVASTMKDVVPRYWTMKGKKVERKWGWDCHGLPIENIAEQALNVKHKKDIEEVIGVDKFNETCRSKVLGYVEDWKVVIRRLGRWVDMGNAYSTMDLPYMESVWWVFKQLWEKGLIYEGYRSMHICPRCETTLSQSEVSEGYKDVKDLSVTVKFHLLPQQRWGNGQETKDSVYVLAWTTTPWTLIGNVALAVGKDISYTALRVDGVPELLVLASDRVSEIFKERQIEIVHNDIKGSDLIGLKYEPVFDYYAKQENFPNKENGWKIYEAPFVTTEDGTGVVHIAPAFGEDDMKLGQENDLPFVQHVGMDGVIKPEAREFAGLHVKPKDDVQATDVEIIKNLAGRNLLFAKEKFEHSYPHCWRCETPLLNYATSSWFVNVGAVKDRAIELAKEISWSPKHIKEGRFGKWLEGARDWSISRQRYWASCMPLWKCQSAGCDEMKVVGSVSELEGLSGQKVTDLHKDKLDKVTFSCVKCGGEMKRIPDVLDTWFDSGSMPYAQLHYPFENEEKFDQGFPADFIAEGADQTRAWFYYLHLISASIMDKPAYKNVIVNGIVLAEDGKKMSKRLQNYPDPSEMFDRYGADVLRFYLLSSPVMQADNLNFKEAELAELSRGMFRMLWNSYSFFVLYANIDNWEAKSDETTGEPTNLLDKWIISELNMLTEKVNKAMGEYNLMKAARLFPPFIDLLSNWYIRRSRKRFWKSENDLDKNSAYATLHSVIVTLAKLMAPFAPFLTEDIYKNLTNKESVHLSDFPEANNEQIDEGLMMEMQEARLVVEAGLSARAGANIKVRQPLNSLTYFGKRLRGELEEIVAEEVNVKTVHFSDSKLEAPVELDTNISEALKEEGMAREIIRNIQSLRKKNGFSVEDKIEVFYTTQSDMIRKVFSNLSGLIGKEVLAREIKEGIEPNEGQEDYLIEQEKVTIGLKRC